MADQNTAGAGEDNDLPGIPAAILRWASRTPSAVAIECGPTSLTYRDLDTGSAGVAERLSADGAHPGNLIALPTHRTPATVTALMGILRAGCNYLPLDAMDSPRAHRILELGRPDLVFDDPDLLSLQPRRCSPAASRGRREANEADLSAYVMPTSGSGGALKLVEVPHASVLHNLHGLAERIGGLGPDDAYLHTASFSFSSSIRQLILPLMNGARVVLADETQRLDPDELLRLCADRAVTVLDLIPSVLGLIVDLLRTLPAEPARALVSLSLRLLLVASEPLPESLVREWRDASGRPDVPVFNMYGQTETAGIVCARQVGQAQGNGMVALGGALPGTEVILDPVAGDAAEVSPVAEILVCGPGVGYRYRGDPVLTAAHFQTRTAGEGQGRVYRTGDLGRLDEYGELQFVGRSDRMVKVRGHRVDLAHVESLIRGHRSVQDCAVVQADRLGRPLHAFVELRTGWIEAEILSRSRVLPNGLRILDLAAVETDFLYEEIFVQDTYGRHGIELPGDAVVVDAGANIGLFSLSVVSVHPNAHIIAVEPAPVTAQTLRTNMRLNGCSSVRVREEGLADRGGRASFTWYPRSPGLSSFHPDQEEASTLHALIAVEAQRGTIPEGHDLREQAEDLVQARLHADEIECRVVPLSDLIDQEGLDQIDLLKIDVQKSEEQVLRGIRDEHWTGIQQIVAEVHDTDGRLDRMAAELERRGYVVSSERQRQLAATNLHHLYARRLTARPGAPRSGPQRRRADVHTVSRAQLMAFIAENAAAGEAPAALQILHTLPRTSSGKPDLPELTIRASQAPVTQTTAAARVEASKSTFEVLRAIWQEVLGKPVQPGDDFFGIGGSSLSGAQVVARARKALGLPALSIRLIFDVPRLELFSAAVQSLRDRPHP